MTGAGYMVWRMCIGCRRRRPTVELIRLGRLGAEVQLFAQSGRGAWICSDSERCVREAFKDSRLSKALRIPISPARLSGLQDSLGVERSGCMQLR